MKKSSSQTPDTSQDEFADFSNFESFPNNDHCSETEPNDIVNDSCADKKGDQRPESIDLHNDISSSSASQSVSIDTNEEPQRMTNGELTDSGVYSSNVSPVQQTEQAVPENKQNSGAEAVIDDSSVKSQPLDAKSGDTVEISEVTSKEKSENHEQVIENNDEVTDNETHVSDLTDGKLGSGNDNDTQEINVEAAEAAEPCVISDSQSEKCDTNFSDSGIPSTDIPTCETTSPCDLKSDVENMSSIPNNSEAVCEQFENEVIEISETLSESCENRNVQCENTSTSIISDDKSLSHNGAESAFIENPINSTSKPNTKTDHLNVADDNIGNNDERVAETTEGFSGKSDRDNEEFSEDINIEPKPEEVSSVSANENESLDQDMIDEIPESETKSFNSKSSECVESTNVFTDELKHSSKKENSSSVTNEDTNSEINSSGKSKGDDLGELSNSNLEETADDDFGDFGDFNSSFNVTSNNNGESDDWSAFSETNNATSEPKSDNNETKSEWAAFSSPSGNTVENPDSKDGDDGDDWAAFSEPQTKSESKDENDDGNMEDWGDFGDDEKSDMKPSPLSSVSEKTEEEKLSAAKLQSMVSFI